MSGESAPEPQNKVHLYTLVMVAVLALAAVFFRSAPPAPAPAPVVIQPAAPAPAPAPAPVSPCSPCGPKRCPFRSLPFEASCPYCRNKLVAVPPDADATGHTGSFVPALKGVGVVTPKAEAPKK